MLVMGDKVQGFLMEQASHLRRRCYAFVILLGIVSCLADICYEGARSVTGPYLAFLGANAATVGIVAGAGELVGYGFRYVSGLISDRFRNYWPLTILGYVVNLAAVPLLALTTTWPAACGLIIMERFGKAIRTPPRDVMLSYASEKIGRGWGFGIHKALDQVGALVGPFLMALLLYLYGSYRFGFGVMVIPALLCLTVLIFARISFPKPQELESQTPRLSAKGFNRRFWIYIAAVCCIAFGFIDFPLIAFHYVKQNNVPVIWIPIFYGIAMGVDGLAALILGRWFDRAGIKILIYISLLTAFMAPLAFAGNFYAALAGIVLWGIGMGAQDSVIKAFVAEMVPVEKRGSAYGLSNMLFGVSWFAGSALMGVIYDISIPMMITISTASILASIPFLLALRK